MPAIAPERVLKELEQLWAGLASPEAGASTESGVLRACAMTFIVALEPGDDAQSVGQTIAELIHQHPSRAIVLKPGAESAPVDARVSAQCWMPFGKRQQVCCEQIEITAPPSDAVQASRLILGLLAPDLPAVLWCRGTAWLKSPGFSDLLPLMTKVIIDAGRGCGVSEIASLRNRARRVADLEWTRMTRTRQEIARFFDDPRNAAQVKTINAIIVPPGQRYLGAWLLRVLPGRKLAMDGPPSRIRLEGPGIDFEFAIVPSPETDYALLNEELGITGTDPVFEGVLPVVETLA
jgi:Glucose-6-phosphate dehydrogenase subunit